jgi:hypothetical protein
MRPVPAILFLIFNRPDTTSEVFEVIKRQKPEKLYVAADGPRGNIEGEAEKCKKVRESVLSGIDWNCEIKTLFRKENIGCGSAVSEAINWFFEQEEEGIILEDDCCPSDSFFSFCSELLEKYRHNQMIYSISGTSFVNANNKASYYFSRHYEVWGWATWRRAWKNYDYSMKEWPAYKESGKIQEVYRGKMFKKYWYLVLDGLFNLENKYTWDFQWMFTCWLYNGLTIHPNINLVSNIGFDDDATHTKNNDSKHGDRVAGEIRNIVHPKSMHTINWVEKVYLEKRYFIRNRWKSYWLHIRKVLGLKPMNRSINSLC